MMTRSQYAEEALRNDDDIKLGPCGVPEGTNEGNQWVESGDDNESEIVSNSSDVEFREEAEERQDEEMPSGPVAEADELVRDRAMLDSSPLVADVSAEVERLEPSGVEENRGVGTSGPLAHSVEVGAGLPVLQRGPSTW